MPLTAPGTGENCVNVPSPRCPDSPTPQHVTVPPPSSAHPNSSPATTRVTSVRLVAASTAELFNVPSACCPNWFRPTHRAVPSVSVAHVYSPPAETLVGVTAPAAVNC